MELGYLTPPVGMNLFLSSYRFQKPMAEVTRSVRFLNVPAGLWLIAAPWLLDGSASPLASWSSVIAGVLIVSLVVPRGSIRNSYGGWNVYVV